MCSLSWRSAPERGGYQLFFNRDEQKTREPATPPTRWETDGVPFLAPRDGRAGGTWMLTNAHGLTVCLLNHYDADSPATRPPNATSRGKLVLEFGACRDVAEFCTMVPQRQRAGRYPAFWLFAIDAAAAVALWRWDGKELLEIDPPTEQFLTTSSFESEAVIAARLAVRERLGDDLSALHAQHDAATATHSVRMRRPDAQTVSRSEVLVDETTVRVRYQPEAIDSLEELAAVDTSLDRA